MSWNSSERSLTGSDRRRMTASGNTSHGSSTGKTRFKSSLLCRRHSRPNLRGISSRPEGTFSRRQRRHWTPRLICRNLCCKVRSWSTWDQVSNIILLLRSAKWGTSHWSSIGSWISCMRVCPRSGCRRIRMWLRKWWGMIWIWLMQNCIIFWAIGLVSGRNKQ